MSFVVAIACNLFLVMINLFLLTKIQQWHRALRQVRQELTQKERQIQSETIAMIQQINLVSAGANQIIQTKAKVITYQSQLKILLQVLKRIKTISIFKIQ